MDYTFEKSGYIRIDGQEMKEILHEGEPDYYMRDKSKVYVFEFKNVFLGSRVKYSNDFEQIKKAIYTKLVENESGKPKGVKQITQSIQKIRNGELGTLDDYDFDQITIYPIIVYVDFSFNLAGVNYYLNQEFRTELEENGFEKLHKIKDLVLIDIDSFLKFQDLFRSKTLKINNCLNEYYDKVNNSSSLFDRISTFNMFIHNKTRKIDYESPDLFYQEVGKLISEHED